MFLDSRRVGIKLFSGEVGRRQSAVTSGAHQISSQSGEHAQVACELSRSLDRRSAHVFSTDASEEGSTSSPLAYRRACKRRTTAINVGERDHMAFTAPMTTRESVSTLTAPGPRRSGKDSSARMMASGSLRLIW